MAVSVSNKMVGWFAEKECGNQYSFMLNPDPNTAPAFPHLIVVGPKSETRMAVIKKTVAYVVLDEVEGGNFYIEKWQIKKKVIY